jgi:hypothetical protein
VTKPIQLSLVNQHTLNVDQPIKDAMNNDVRNNGLNREQIVGRMNELAGRYGTCLSRGNRKRLTIEVFEKRLNPADLSRQMPLKALPVFCAAVETCSTIDVLTRPLGLRVIGDRDQKLLAWAEAKMAVKAHGRQIRKFSRRASCEGLFES